MGWISFLILYKESKVNLPCSTSICTSSKYLRHKMITHIPCYSLTVQTHCRWKRSLGNCQTNSISVSLRNTVNALAVLFFDLCASKADQLQWININMYIWTDGWNAFLETTQNVDRERWILNWSESEKKKEAEGGRKEEKRKRVARNCIVPVALYCQRQEE